jgi:serine protease inhibitor
MNEKGTEAAAATGIAVDGIPEEKPKMPKFIADHPFAFMLILNSGRPSGSGGSTILFLFNGTYSGSTD